MSTPTSEVPDAVWDEVEESLRIASSNVRDPEVMRRASDRMDQLRESIRQRVGVVDLVLPALREMRNGA